MNCGAIPEPLLESELFGHVKGAFTGAPREPTAACSRSPTAARCLLDEIGDMPLAAAGQAAARAAGTTSAPVGASASVPIDVRILSATHRDLEAAMAEGQFREDLYYRLNVVSLTLPTLDERREDILLLAQHFLQKLAASTTSASTASPPTR